MANKVNYGLKNVHYSKITYGLDGKVSYGEVKPIKGAVSLTLDVVGESTPFYADDIVYYNVTSNNGYEGTLEIAKIPQEFATEILGEVLDNDTKVLIESADAKPSEFALMFEFDGDVKATRHVFYRCSASRPSISGATKEDAVEVSTTELTFSAMAREGDLNIKTKTTTETLAHIYDSWYRKVHDGIKNTFTPTAPTYAKGTGQAQGLNIVIASAEDINVTHVNIDGVDYESATNTNWQYTPGNKTLNIKHARLQGLNHTPGTTQANIHNIIIKTDKGNDILVPVTINA